MFTSPQPNLYQSTDGFSVEVLGSTGLRYCEGTRKMFVDSEVLSRPAGLVVYRESIARWDPPCQTESVGESERERILANISEAFRFQGFEIQVI